MIRCKCCDAPLVMELNMIAVFRVPLDDYGCEIESKGKCITRYEECMIHDPYDARPEAYCPNCQALGYETGYRIKWESGYFFAEAL